MLMLSAESQGGGRRHCPYPKENMNTFRWLVVSTGTNTAICVLGIGLAAFGVWWLSSSKKTKDISLVLDLCHLKGGQLKRKIWVLGRNDE
ncbi:hypothetical protein I203_100570 [Kwoniella mangroviensis CBS 8507]|uniref:uncharacterized protein n=1 Tax=Kwoniella mangroviensis CBS 8507 TaxID=1296122 RepID=UPI00302700E5